MDNLLGRYETWEEARSDNNIRAVFNKESELAKANTLSDLDLTVFSGLKTKNEFASLKSRGVGRNTILSYLGKPWAKKGWMIQAALAPKNAR